MSLSNRWSMVPFLLKRYRKLLRFFAGGVHELDLRGHITHIDEQRRLTQRERRE